MVESPSKYAERAFESLCACAGATCNRSLEDEYGWDHLVEFPAEAVAGLPPDLQPAHVAAFVQVKSTTGKKAQCVLKLSNALRFAKSTSPCFLVLMVVGERPELTRIYAVHFWEQLIARTLKRARECDRDAKDKLHRLTLTVSFGSTDEHGEDVVRWIRKTIAAVGPDYAAEKTKIIKSVGSEEWIGQVEIGPLESITELVDHQLGLFLAHPCRRDRWRALVRGERLLRLPRVEVGREELYPPRSLPPFSGRASRLPENGSRVGGGATGCHHLRERPLQADHAERQAGSPPVPGLGDARGSPGDPHGRGLLAASAKAVATVPPDPIIGRVHANIVQHDSILPELKLKDVVVTRVSRRELDNINLARADTL